MITFSIDSSTNKPIFVLSDNGVVKSFSSEILSNSLSTKGIELIDSVLKKANLSVSDIQLAGAIIGPGSFTGLRIGLSMLKGILYPYGIKIVPINSLRLLADPYLKKDKDVFVLLNAFMGEIYFARYNANGDELIPVSVATPDSIISKLNGDLIVTGEFDKFKEYFDKATSLNANFMDFDEVEIANSLAKLTVNGKENAISSSECSPEYFRKSAAEINLDKNKLKK